MTPFTGFSTKTTKFLRDLGRHNDKAWFDAHRGEYEQYWLEPARAFIDAVGPKVQTFAPNIVWEPRVNGSIFRVNRDIRFSKDKTPYKDHIDFWLWEGQRSTAVSGFFLRIRAKSIHLGVGSHGFSKEALASYRKALENDGSAESLASLIKRLERAGYTLGGKTYKRPPPGFDGQGAAREFVLHGALWVDVERRPPSELRSNAFAAYCTREWKKMAPLHRWLMQEVAQ